MPPGACCKKKKTFDKDTSLKDTLLGFIFAYCTHDFRSTVTVVILLLQFVAYVFLSHSTAQPSLVQSLFSLLSRLLFISAPYVERHTSFRVGEISCVQRTGNTLPLNYVFAIFFAVPVAFSCLRDKSVASFCELNLHEGKLRRRKTYLHLY